MAIDLRSTVGLRDIVKGLPGLGRDLPGIVRNVGALLTGPDKKWSIGLVFQEAAHRHPDRCFLRFEGRDYSYGEANAIVNRYAAVLSGHGLQRGDVVGIMLTNRPETLFLVLATVKLGATAGMLNHHQRGDVLAHSIGLLQSRVLVVGSECRMAVDELGTLSTAVVAAEDLEQASHDAPTDDPEVCAQITAAERAFLVFTSGTTGLPKASVMSHQRWSKSFAGFGAVGVRLRAGDTLYCCLPLYHNNALTVSLASVLAGDATLALGRKFSASQFWSDIIANQATSFVYIGELCRYLLNQPATATDRRHQVRVMVGNGLRPELWDAFRERFGVRRIVEFYGGSEVPLAFINIFNADKTAGFGALPYAVVEYDDETGRASRGPDGKLHRVGRGNVGLLLSEITARTPFDSYTDDKAGEQKLIHDGFRTGDVWFDTGDLVLDQGRNHIAFVDRLGDTFRWKGENVATTEVEAVIGLDDSIDHIAVYGVAIPGAEGKAGMAAVTLHPGAQFDGAGLARRLYQQLPSYAVPLFIRVVDELEQTSTFRNRKVELRNAGYASAAEGSLYVLEGRDNGYVDAYDGFATEVAEGKRPRP